MIIYALLWILIREKEAITLSHLSCMSCIPNELQCIPIQCWENFGLYVEAIWQHTVNNLEKSKLVTWEKSLIKVTKPTWLAEKEVCKRNTFYHQVRITGEKLMRTYKCIISFFFLSSCIAALLIHEYECAKLQRA